MSRGSSSSTMPRMPTRCRWQEPSRRPDWHRWEQASRPRSSLSSPTACWHPKKQAASPPRPAQPEPNRGTRTGSSSVKDQYPRAYERWNEAEEERLRHLRDSRLQRQADLKGSCNASREPCGAGWASWDSRSDNPQPGLPGTATNRRRIPPESRRWPCASRSCRGSSFSSRRICTLVSDGNHHNRVFRRRFMAKRTSRRWPPSTRSPSTNSESRPRNGRCGLRTRLTRSRPSSSSSNARQSPVSIANSIHVSFSGSVMPILGSPVAAFDVCPTNGRNPVAARELLRGVGRPRSGRPRLAASGAARSRRCVAPACAPAPGGASG